MVKMGDKQQDETVATSESEDDDEMEMCQMEGADEEMEDENEDEKVYLPGEPIEEGEELVCDESAYMMYHQAQTGARFNLIFKK